MFKTIHRTLNSPRSLRTLRALALAFALCYVGLHVKSQQEAGIFVSGTYVSLANACLHIGKLADQNLPTRTVQASELGSSFGPLYWSFNWNADFATAWRPFRQSQTTFRNLHRNGLVVPLWPVLFASLGTAGYATGYLRALRRLRTTHCPTCNYDLRGIPSASEAPGSKPGNPITCPECGKLSVIGEIQSI